MTSSWYRKKPVAIEAMRYEDNLNELIDWGATFDLDSQPCGECLDKQEVLYLHTPTGLAMVRPGDMVARQPLPEGGMDYWPIAYEQFIETYEPA